MKKDWSVHVLIVIQQEKHPKIPKQCFYANFGRCFFSAKGMLVSGSYSHKTNPFLNFKLDINFQQRDILQRRWNLCLYSVMGWLIIIYREIQNMIDTYLWCRGMVIKRPTSLTTIVSLANLSFLREFFIINILSFFIHYLQSSNITRWGEG